jgi:hypothetical protein
VSGARRRNLRFAVPALLLALLVPARAVALCCFDGRLADRGSHAGAHGSSHHAHARALEMECVLVPAAPAPDCETLTSAAPALRERDRIDTAPGAVGASPPTANLLPPGPAKGPVILPDALAGVSAHREAPHPLRR